MYEWEVQIRRPWNSNQITHIIESTAADLELTQTMKSTLRSFEGCVHWHFKKLADRGVLEVTMWPKAQRVWISVQSGRRAEWIDREAPRIRRALQRAFRTEH